MVVGIMSMQRVCNYGSFLQAYALKKTIEKLGYDVVFVDYKKGFPICNNHKEKCNVNKKIILNTCLTIVEKIRILDFVFPAYIKQTIKESRIHKKALKEYLNVTSQKTYRKVVDTLIIGSDEVFNCTQANPNVGYSEELFGKSANSNNVISYAASFGNTTLDKIRFANKESNLSLLLSKFSNISVRDDNSCKIVKSLIGKEPNINFDPVLIYDFNSDVKNVCNLTNFIIVYAYRNRLTNKEKEAIVNFAKSTNKKIVCIGGYQDFGDVHFSGDAFEVLDYFSKADFVFTDTFHGSIMSIINHKPFLTFVRKSVGDSYGNSEKLEDLLKRLGLENRACTKIDDLGKLIETEIDYTFVDEVIKAEKEKALEYLKSSIN